MNVKKPTKYFVGLTLLNKVDQLADGERGKNGFQHYFISDRAGKDKRDNIRYRFEKCKWFSIRSRNLKTDVRRAAVK